MDFEEDRNNQDIEEDGDNQDSEEDGGVQDTNVDEKSTIDRMKWAGIRQVQHRYLPTFPVKIKKDVKVNIELPYPIFEAMQVENYAEFKKGFKDSPKFDTRLNFYKKLSSKRKKLLIKDIDKSNYLQVPRYIVDIASGSFDSIVQPVWYYTGGTLDVFSCSDAVYVARADSIHAVYITSTDMPNDSISIGLDSTSPVYGLKTCGDNQNAVIAVRQKCKISLFNLFNDTNLEPTVIWKMQKRLNFTDVTFNQFRCNEIAFVDNAHQFEVQDFEKNKELVKYSFPKEAIKTSNDCFAQLGYIDNNTMCFMNPSYIYLLDLRSRSLQKSCFSKSWLQCDDLCTFSMNSADTNNICVSSMHNAVKFDVRTLTFDSKVAHMLTTPPLISSITTDLHGEYICLFGQQIDDKVLLFNHKNSINVPQYVPNTKHAFMKTILTRKINYSEEMEERLSLPIIGMKLYKDPTSGNAVLYTSNSAGDVFKQNILQTKPQYADSIDRLTDWISKLHHTPKVLEATGLCNLNNVMNTVCRRVPKDKKILSLMKEDNSKKLHEKEFLNLSKQLEGSVGDAMNTIWIDEKIVGDTEDSGISSAMSSKHKVSEWLDNI